MGQVWGSPRVGSGATTAGEQEGSPPLRPKAVQQYRARLARAAARPWRSLRSQIHPGRPVSLKSGPPLSGLGRPRPHRLPGDTDPASEFMTVDRRGLDRSDAIN